MARSNSDSRASKAQAALRAAVPPLVAAALAATAACAPAVPALATGIRGALTPVQAVTSVLATTEAVTALAEQVVASDPFLTSKAEEVDDDPITPAVRLSIAPTSGPPGTRVVLSITGTDSFNFLKYIVLFGGSRTSASPAGSLILGEGIQWDVKVPADATTGTVEVALLGLHLRSEETYTLTAP